MGKSGLKWGKVGRSGDMFEKLGKNWEKWEEVGKSAESGEMWRKVLEKALEKVVKSGEKWRRWENVLFKSFGQNGRRRPFWMSENNFRSQFLSHISDRYATFFFSEIYRQNGRRRPFWIGRQCQLSNSNEIFG